VLPERCKPEAGHHHGLDARREGEDRLDAERVE